MKNFCFPSFFKAIGHPVRQRILEELHQAEEMDVKSLVEKLGLAQATVSHHLAILKKAGAITIRTEGTHSFCSVCCRQAAKCCSALRKFFNK